MIFKRDAATGDLTIVIPKQDIYRFYSDLRTQTFGIDEANFPNLPTVRLLIALRNLVESTVMR